MAAVGSAGFTLVAPGVLILGVVSATVEDCDGTVGAEALAVLVTVVADGPLLPDRGITGPLGVEFPGRGMVGLEEAGASASSSSLSPFDAAAVRLPVDLIHSCHIFNKADIKNQTEKEKW